MSGDAGQGRRPLAARLLIGLWATVLGLTVVGAVVLQTLGPPQGAPDHPAAAAALPSPQRALAEAPPPASSPIVPGRGTPGPIASPDPALLEPAGPDGSALPRIGRDGRAAMQVYARGFDASSRRPRVGIILAGIAANVADSEAAVRTLTPEITFAVTPYLVHADALLDAMRLAGHEYLLSLPLEPQGFPLNDAGDHALLTGATDAANAARLTWALARVQGYVGATDAIGPLRGERYAQSGAQMGAVLHELRTRGLLFVDARPDAPPSPEVWSRAIDLVVDEPPDAAAIDAKLARLEQRAREHGSALGLAGAVRPTTVARLQVWASGLRDRGMVLAPVSALVHPPLGDDATAGTEHAQK